VFTDNDIDGYGVYPLVQVSFTTDAAVAASCSGNAQGQDVAPKGIDCNDGDATLNWDDSDGDGEPSCIGDCDDTDPAVRHGHDQWFDAPPRGQDVPSIRVIMKDGKFYKNTL